MEPQKHGQRSPTLKIGRCVKNTIYSCPLTESNLAARLQKKWESPRYYWEILFFFSLEESIVLFANVKALAVDKVPRLM